MKNYQNKFIKILIKSSYNFRFSFLRKILNETGVKRGRVVRLLLVSLLELLAQYVYVGLRYCQKEL